MNCGDVKNRLDPWLDRETKEDETRELEDHVSGCNLCREMVEGEKALRQLLQLRLTERAPSGLVERVRGKISHPASFWRRHLITGAAAVLLIGLVGMVIFGNSGSVAAHTLAQNAIHRHEKSVGDPHALDAVLCAADCCPQNGPEELKNFFARRLSFSPCMHDLSDLGYQRNHGLVWEVRRGKNASWTRHEKKDSEHSISHASVAGMEIAHGGGEPVRDGARLYKKNRKEVVLIFPDKNGITCLFVFDSLEEARRYLNSH